MKIALMLSMLVISSPLAGRAQSLQLDTQVIDSTPRVLPQVKATRVGVSRAEHKRGQWPIVPSGADTSRSARGSRGYHALMGVVVGTLGGAAIGATIGAIADAGADSDAMIPATAILAAYGTVVGLVVGLLVGLVWPTK
jgi:cytochrome c biogenesis protein CcdA